ncbi:unnamed protein product [Knipowitschia caucasica]|uniref:WAP domain-containing protein n=1 Tax=Knipowitschia caucasica TaxID=637954 RepID=A0AAV2LXW9_KNICA
MELSVLCLLTLALAFVPQLSATVGPSVPLVKDGVCPKPTLVMDPSVVRCLIECTSDWECPEDKKCCENACGHIGICVTPKKVFAVPKKGFCPTPEGFGICVEQCSTDHDCEKNLKCCSNNCGKTCVEPLMKEKRGRCPAPFTRLDCKRDDKCNNDYDCKDGLKCCFDGCEKICRKPLERKKGICPKPIPHFAECDATCDNHNKCEGDLLCCYSGCGMECLEPFMELRG